jgi:hypothetical protein
MPRHPIAGAGAAVRTPSGAAARASASPPQPSSPLPPQRYRALRARYNALLIVLYERTSLTLREIAAVAGHTERAVQMLARALGCRARHAKKCRPGTNLGARRAGPKPPQLNAPATRRTVAAFASVARELAAYTEARVASDARRATARTMQRTARAQNRVIASAARELGHLAVVIENAAGARHALAAGRKGKSAHSRAGEAGPAAKRQSRVEMRDAQERVMREQQARMHAMHAAARATPAAAAATPPDDRRIDAIAERYYAERGPRVRRL